MAHLLKLKKFPDARGTLVAADREIPFPIQRVYFIYGVTGDSVRAGHRHKKNIQALICLGGRCEVSVNDGKSKATYQLDSQDKCLILAPEDWHTLQKFSKDAILVVMASEHYDINDYIDEPYHD